MSAWGNVASGHRCDGEQILGQIWFQYDGSLLLGTAERGTSAEKERKHESEAILTRRFSVWKEDAISLEMSLNRTCVVARQHRWWPYHRSFAFDCDCRICDYTYAAICDAYFCCNKFTSFVPICVAWVWKSWFNIYTVYIKRFLQQANNELKR